MAASLRGKGARQGASKTTPKESHEGVGEHRLGGLHERRGEALDSAHGGDGGALRRGAEGEGQVDCAQAVIAPAEGHLADGAKKRAQRVKADPHDGLGALQGAALALREATKGAGEGGHEDVIHRRVQGPAGRLHVVQGDAHAVEARTEPGPRTGRDERGRQHGWEAAGHRGLATHGVFGLMNRPSLSTEGGSAPMRTILPAAAAPRASERPSDGGGGGGREGG